MKLKLELPVKFFAIGTLLLSCFASANEIVVKKLNADRTRFSAAVADAATEVGQVFEMKDEFNQLCSAVVESKAEDLLVLNIGKCDARKDLKEGDKFLLNASPVVETPPIVAAEPVAPVLPPPAPVAQEEKEESGRWRFGMGLGYQIATSEAKFNDAYFSNSSNSITGKAEMEFKPAFAITLEGQYRPRHAWGFQGGLNYEGDRRIEKLRIYGNGYDVTLVATSDSEQVQFSTFYASAVYRWDQFYIPFGLNFSVVKYKPVAGDTTSVNINGGLGAQVGIGWIFSDLFALELYSWVTTMKLNTASSTVVGDYGRGTFESLLLMTKFSF